MGSSSLSLSWWGLHSLHLWAKNIWLSRRPQESSVRLHIKITYRSLLLVSTLLGTSSPSRKMVVLGVETKLPEPSSNVGDPKASPNTLPADNPLEERTSPKTTFIPVVRAFNKLLLTSVWLILSQYITLSFLFSSRPIYSLCCSCSFGNGMLHFLPLVPQD